MLKKLWAKFKKEREGDRKADRDTGRQKESESERERERGCILFEKFSQNSGVWSELILLEPM